MIFFIQFEATPAPQHPRSDEVAGAIVLCWIDRPDRETAIDVAQRKIRDEQWIINEPDEVRVVERDYYLDNPAGMAFYEQALTDREVLCFHMYPIVEQAEAE